MASNESETFGELITTTAANMNSESNEDLNVTRETETAAVPELSTATTVTLTTTTSSTQRPAAYRGVRFATSEVDPNDDEEDSWWWEVENENLTLDQVPNVTAVFTPSPEDILEKPPRVEETQNVVLEENFDRLHRIADRIKNTMNEQRERHLSESSDKSSTEYAKLETEIAKSDSTSSAGKEQTLEEFKEELRLKRLARQTAVQDLRDEIATLRKQLELERETSKRLRNGEKVEETSSDLDHPKAQPNTSCIDEADFQGACALSNASSALATLTAVIDDDDDNPVNRSRHANIELANAQLALQMANSENISLRGELDVVQKQVGTLKEVIACCKQMLTVKEEQCNELKERLTEIEKSFAEHEMKIMSDHLREEYERQLVNIRQLRQLYEERQRVAAAEYENLQRLISIKRDELAQEQEKTKSLEERNENMVKEMDAVNNELACLRDECKEHRFEKTALKEEMGAVNTLFSQMVMGFNGKNNLDIDRLTTMLEENRTLLNDMATKECSDGATLPKLLFELVEQASVDDNKEKTSCLRPILGTEMTHKPDNNAIVLAMEPGNVDEDGDGDGDDDGEAEIGASQDEDDIEVEGNDNETASASVANDNNDNDNDNSSSTATTAQATTEQQSDQENVDTSAVAVAGTASSVASESTNEKVIVTLQQTKSKKHHSHHRKSSSSKKANTSSLSNAAATSASAATENFTLKFNDPEVIGKVTSTQEIIGNLPKVWRVLMELLNHHHIDPVQFEENGKGEDCYKSVETPHGPKPELSVSKTYLKLRDLIMEKKSLVKETNRLKTLNCHLDYRLNEQEKRLSAVSLELTKTWHLVGKMQRQHRQLHTQEQILRYQLQQKRRLLHELKDELEYCRRKWQAARAKNDESQEQCNDLRREFARRKLEDANNSAESGYSDSGGPVSDEEPLTAAAEGAVGGPKGSVGSGGSAINDDEDEVCESAMTASTSAGGCVNYRRKRLREMFEHTRKIKRMQSTSPSRANGLNADDSEMVVLRWNSAPPTCGWRDTGGGEDEDDSEVETPPNGLLLPAGSPAAGGAIPKSIARPSRRPKRRSVERSDDAKIDLDLEPVVVVEAVEDRAFRIKRLEEQCKTLIQQVLETSDNRERLEVQLKRFQDEMSPVQYAVPLDEIVNKKRVERMTRASSAPASGSLTPREEEYTRRRSERLGRLEEESRQLLFRIKRTSDRGHYLRCSLDRIRRAPPSREGSLESNTEEESRKSEEESVTNAENTSSSRQPNQGASSKSPLTAEEEAFTARRAARLQRLEEESKQLLNKLSRNNQRGDNLGSRLDTLHERHRSQDEPGCSAAILASSTSASTPHSGQLTTEQRIEQIEKISSNREQRLRILEEEGRQLINRLSETSEKGTQMINRIAERELTRQNRATSTPQRETGEAASSIQNPVVAEEVPLASAILPTLKTVACSSIVSDELTDCVTITTIPSQIAAHQGAIPKSKPTTQLLAARPKSARLQSADSKKNHDSNESLEDMVKRLRSLPFPNKNENETEDKNEESKKNEETSAENDGTVSKHASALEEAAPSDDSTTKNA